MRRRFMLLMVVGALLAPLLFQPVVTYAAECINANKPNGAGNIGDVVIDAGTGEQTLPTNPGRQTAGGFVDVWLDVTGDGEGDVLLVDDTFILNNGQSSANQAPGIIGAHGSTLPEGALQAAGPGRGVDDAEP